MSKSTKGKASTALTAVLAGGVCMLVCLRAASADTVGEKKCKVVYTDCAGVQNTQEWTCNANKQCCAIYNYGTGGCIYTVTTDCCDRPDPGIGGGLE